METCIGPKVAEQSLERSQACSGWLADAHLISSSALTDLGDYALQRLPADST